jgi:hypothetical protein
MHRDNRTIRADDVRLSHRSAVALAIPDQNGCASSAVVRGPRAWAVPLFRVANQVRIGIRIRESDYEWKPVVRVAIYTGI